MLQMSDRYTVNGDTLTIRGVNESDQGQYWCKGQMRSVSSQSSAAVSLSVKGELSFICIIACIMLIKTRDTTQQLKVSD